LSLAGLELGPTTILWHSLAHDYHHVSMGPVAFGTMTLPVEDMAALAGSLVDADLMPPRNRMLITPPPASLGRLQRLHAAAGNLAENAPEILANPDAARGLEQELIETLVEYLGYGDRREQSLAQG
jgi:hypothetical protein